MKKVISFVLLTAFLCSILIIGYAHENVAYSKSMDEIIKEDTVRIKEFLNGELQKNSINEVQPMWIINEWFERYEPDTQVEKKDAYLLASIDFDTTGEAGEYTTVTLEVLESRHVGLETSGTIEITGEIEAAMFASLESKFGASITTSTYTDNQIGVSKEYNVYTGRTGTIKAYYKGVYTRGAIVYGYEDNSGERGEYVKGNGNEIAPYTDDVVRVYFGPVQYD